MQKLGLKRWKGEGLARVGRAVARARNHGTHALETPAGDDCSSRDSVVEGSPAVLEPGGAGEEHQVPPSLWTSQLLPEFLWLACLNTTFGWSKGTTIAWRVAEAASKYQSGDDFLWWSRASTFEGLDDDDWGRLSVELEPEIDQLGRALGPLVALFPAVPMASLVPREAIPDADTSRNTILPLVRSLQDRASIDAMRAQGNALYLAVLGGQVLFPGDSPVERLPELRQYPESAASREVGQSVRVMTNALYGFSSASSQRFARTWPTNSSATLRALASDSRPAEQSPWRPASTQRVENLEEAKDLVPVGPF